MRMTRVLLILPFVVALTAARALPFDDAQAKGGMKTFRDPAFGIALELPDSWSYRVTPAKDYMFEGPKGTEAYELSLVVQFVTKAANPGSSATAQLRKVAAQLQAAPNGAIKSNGSVAVGGTKSPFFVATYSARDSAGVMMPFAHTQVVVDRGDYYYLISFSGPSKTYEKLLPVFEHALGSVTFTK